MKANTVSIEEVVITLIALDPTDMNKMLLQVFNKKGELIAVDPTSLHEEIARQSNSFNTMYEKCLEAEKLLREEKNNSAKAIRNGESMIEQLRNSRKELLDRAVEAMFPLLQFAERGMKLGKVPTKKQQQQMKEAKAFFAEINSTSSKYTY